MIGHCNLCSIDILNSVLQGGNGRLTVHGEGVADFFRASTICLTGTGQGVGHGGLVQGSERGSEAIQAGQVCVQVRRLQANVTEKLLRLLVEGKTAVVAAAAATTAASLAARAVAAALLMATTVSL